MSLCLYNLTLGIYTASNSDYIKFENNTKISGLIGQLLDEFLVHKNQRFAINITSLFKFTF